MARRQGAPLRGARFCINTNPLQPEVHDLDNESSRCCIDEIIDLHHAEPCNNVAIAVLAGYPRCKWCMKHI